jgi:hypothetical protein
MLWFCVPFLRFVLQIVVCLLPIKVFQKIFNNILYLYQKKTIDEHISESLNEESRVVILKIYGKTICKIFTSSFSYLYL